MGSSPVRGRERRGYGGGLPYSQSFSFLLKRRNWKPGERETGEKWGEGERIDITFFLSHKEREQKREKTYKRKGVGEMNHSQTKQKGDEEKGEKKNFTAD